MELYADLLLHLEKVGCMLEFGCRFVEYSKEVIERSKEKSRLLGAVGMGCNVLSCWISNLLRRKAKMPSFSSALIPVRRHTGSRFLTSRRSTTLLPRRPRTWL
ncbi:hypothetical protein PVAP13_8KG160200 [Panicum virgatum]|uniref:Uncharacterized protein n=1 Tax=Panicum virgatum TaxID=38727 RepID=A0A8T0PTI6_PANVG|nr:hypothetical protein PVAP13_8KG160200 [Panicum virgatum]